MQYPFLTTTALAVSLAAPASPQELSYFRILPGISQDFEAAKMGRQIANTVYQRELERQGRGQEYRSIGTSQFFDRFQNPNPRRQFQPQTIHISRNPNTCFSFFCW